MKFDAARLPDNMKLVGMTPLEIADVEQLKHLQSIREDAMRRYNDIVTRTEELRRQYDKASKAMDGRLVELTWKFGWDEAYVVIFDDETGMLYGLAPKAHDHGPFEISDSSSN